MKDIAELNRVNFANTIHHRELIRKQIDPAVIERIEVSQNPSLNYRTAFKNVYQDELERTVEEQKEKKNAMKSLYLQTEGNGSAIYGNSRMEASIGAHQHSYSRLKQFADFEEEKSKRYNTLVERQLNQGHSFFRAQDEYQKRKQLELQTTNLMLQQQMQLKERQKFMGAQENAKENDEVRENRRRQMEMEMLEKQQNRLAQQGLAYEIQGQIEKQRIRRQHKSIMQMGGEGRHNPITNPIEYHIDNPYILNKIQQRQKWGGPGCD